MPAAKLTPEIEAQVCGFLRAGCTLKLAAEATGITEQTLRKWLARGEAENPRARADYASFREEVLKAKGSAEAILVTRISKAAANGSWQAAAWLLERGYGGRWRKDASELPPPLDEPDDPFEELDELAPRRAAKS